MPAPSPTEPRSGQFGPAIYADWRRSSLGEITEALEHRLLFDPAGPLEGLAVLDAGCGDGTLALMCAQRGAAHVSGCDPDPRMVERAQTRMAENGVTVEIRQAAAEGLPYADNSFDVVSCVTVLTFVPDVAAALREIARVLRPGGRLVIGDLGKWSVWAARRHIRGWLGSRLWRAARFRTAHRLAQLVADTGLVVSSTRGAIFFPPWTPAARMIASIDATLGRFTTLGAAFIAVQAAKPGG